MYENRWPRPGPGMVAIFAVIGLIGGILAGLFNAPGAQRGPGQAASDRTAQERSSSSTALPKSFYTVIVASVAVSQSRSVADARAKAIRESGVEDVGVLDSSRYHSLSANYWAVYSGVFSTWEQAINHRDQIRAAHPDLANCYAKQVTDQS